MDELVKKYLDEAKAIEQEIEENKALKEKKKRDEFLISIGLVKGVERRYNDRYEYPYNTWDKEKKLYYYDAKIPVEVTDEELEDLKRYRVYHDAETKPNGQHFIPVHSSNGKHSSSTSNTAEDTLSTINSIFLVFALVGGLFLLFFGEYGAMPLGIGIMVVGLITWAVVKVYINISDNLREIRKNTDKSKLE